MKRIRSRVAVAIAVAGIMTTAGVTAAQVDDSPPAGDAAIPAVDSGDQGDTVDALSTNCKKTFSSGSGATRFVWCFSNDGNIVKMEHSVGLEHVGNGVIIEGFCLSAGGVKRGESDGGFNGNTDLNAPTYPSATKVQHVTADGSFRIEQAFAQTTSTKSINVTMKITNISGVNQSDVFVTRFVDADLSNTAGDDLWVSANRSVAALEPGSSRMELLPTSTFTANSMIYPSFPPVNNQFCYDPASDGTTTAPAGDQSMGVLQQLGTINNGASKTVKFTYQLSI